MDCLFCKIVKGEIPSYKIYEDELVYAFLDIHPHGNGHTLVIPKKHYKDFTELPDDLILHINKVAKEIVSLLVNKLNAKGFSITTNYLEMQEVKHYHLHIIPMAKDKIKPIEAIWDILK